MDKLHRERRGSPSRATGGGAVTCILLCRVYIALDLESRHGAHTSASISPFGRSIAPKAKARSAVRFSTKAPAGHIGGQGHVAVWTEGRVRYERCTRCCTSGCQSVFVITLKRRACTIQTLLIILFVNPSFSRQLLGETHTQTQKHPQANPKIDHGDGGPPQQTQE